MDWSFSSINCILYLQPVVLDSRMSDGMENLSFQEKVQLFEFAINRSSHWLCLELSFLKWIFFTLINFSYHPESFLWTVLVLLRIRSHHISIKKLILETSYDHVDLFISFLGGLIYHSIDFKYFVHISPFFMLRFSAGFFRFFTVFVSNFATEISIFEMEAIFNLRINSLIKQNVINV